MQAFDDLLYLWISAPLPVLALISALFGLLLGSFLNVVIYRLPLMIEREYAVQLIESNQPAPDFNLAWPSSHCPACQTPIKAWHNIPLVSFIVLKGCCQQCRAPISWQYPAVELLSAILAVASLFVWGLSVQSFILYCVSLVLLALCIIDARTLLLPDALTLPLLWAGLLYQSLYQPQLLAQAVWGAVLGYLVLWSIYWLFKRITGKEGMGYGDFKLLAALGAWLGAAQLPAVMLLSAGAGLLLALLMKLRDKDRQMIPFGPALAVSGWLCLAFPDTVRSLMMQIFI